MRDSHAIFDYNSEYKIISLIYRAGRRRDRTGASPRFVPPSDSVRRRIDAMGQHARRASPSPIVALASGKCCTPGACALGSPSLRTGVATRVTCRQFSCAFAKRTNDENSAPAHRSACATDADLDSLPTRNKKVPLRIRALLAAPITFLSHEIHSETVLRSAKNRFADSGNGAGFCSRKTENGNVTCSTNYSERPR
jgi:hypothetical protein